MNLAELQKKLTDAARMQAPDERVPYAFEKRIMALVGSRVAVDRRGLWAQGLWRAAVACLVIAAVAFVVSTVTVPSASENNWDLSQEFENTLLASVDQPEYSQMP
jgi:anti-sigma-K factor RskA